MCVDGAVLNVDSTHFSAGEMYKNGLGPSFGVPFPVDVAAFDALRDAALVPLLQAYGLAEGGPAADWRAALIAFMSRL